MLLGCLPFAVLRILHNGPRIIRLAAERVPDIGNDRRNRILTANVVLRGKDEGRGDPGGGEGKIH